MDNIDPAGSLAGARRQLAQIWADPQVKRIARRWAGDPDLADDALQETYYAMARLERLDGIENLRAYFCRVLARQAHQGRAQLGAVLVEDFAAMAERHESARDPWLSPAGSFEDAVCFSVQAGSWRERLVRAHDQLITAVPARSGEPHRYRAVIYDAVEQILRAGITGEPSEAGTNDAFRVSYPEYFDQPGASPGACHQRFHRARVDVRELLRAVAT